MIRVQSKPEPPGFAKIRTDGQAAIAKMEAAEAKARAEGKAPPKRKYPSHWSKCADDLHEAYGGICAYLCTYVMKASGARTVEHMKPKSRYPEYAYEWSNYRLVCSRLNSRKKDKETVLDPFEIGDDWFLMDMSLLQVVPNPTLPDEIKKKVAETIETLKLNDKYCRSERGHYFNSYIKNDISLEYFQKYAPFVAREFLRHGLSRDGIEVPEKRKKLGKKG